MKNLKFNKKQMEALKDAEQYFYTIKYASYKRASSAKLNELVADILESVINKPVDKNFSCAKCIYNIFEQAANIYYSTLEKQKNKENNEKSDNTGDGTGDGKTTGESVTRKKSTKSVKSRKKNSDK